MLYIKVFKDAYNEPQKADAIYPRLRSKALAFIVKKTIARYCKDYPDIDIVIDYKKIRRKLGCLCINGARIHKAYNFIKQGTRSPYIVIYPQSIIAYHVKNPVRGIQETLLHEYVHLRQWLLNEPLQHNRHLSAYSDDALAQIKSHVKELSRNI